MGGEEFIEGEGERGGGGGLGGVEVAGGEGVESFDERAAEDEAFAGELVAEVRGHGGRGGEQAEVVAAGAEAVADFVEDAGGLAGAGGTEEEAHLRDLRVAPAGGPAADLGVRPTVP